MSAENICAGLVAEIRRRLIADGRAGSTDLAAWAMAQFGISSAEAARAVDAAFTLFDPLARGDSAEELKAHAAEFERYVSERREVPT